MGPTLQAYLVLLILIWQLLRFVFICDITQMYRSPSSYISLKNFVPTSGYELQTVTFGVNYAPYILIQLADDCESEYALTSNTLRKSVCVNDVLAVSYDPETAILARN